MATADVEAPFADQLITISGESTSKRVQNLTFTGITFAHTDYQLTDVAGSHGKTTCQAAQTYTAFADSNTLIAASFFSLVQPLSCFSRLMAAVTSVVVSK